MTDETKLVTGDENLSARTDNMTAEDESFLAAAAAVAAPGDTVPEGFVVLTPEMLDQISKDLNARKAEMDEMFPQLVAACPAEIRLAVACWTIKHVLAHAREGGTFRYLIYHRLGFGPEAYAPMQWHGALEVSNEFDLTEETAKERHSEALKTFARAFKKFAPDLADELVKRWGEAKLEERAAIDELLAVLRGQS